jgi:glyoxylase-like metal-dependent hydrolase (beta-lactamase superfamily II)
VPEDTCGRPAGFSTLAPESHAMLGRAGKPLLDELLLERAMTLPVAIPWFSVNEVEEKIFRITEPHCHRLVRANCFLITGGDTDILVDSGMGVSALRPLISSLSTKPLILFTTHTHIDHVGSHPEFQDAEVLVHPLEADELRRPGIKGLRFAQRSTEQIEALRRAGIELTEYMVDAVPSENYDIEGYGRAAVEPTRLIDEGALIDTGSHRFEVLHLPGHTTGGMGLWEARTGLLFSGDVIYDGVIIDTAPTSRVADYIRTMKRLKKLPVRLVFGGHKDSMNRDRMNEIADRYLASREAPA